MSNIPSLPGNRTMYRKRFLLSTLFLLLLLVGLPAWLTYRAVRQDGLNICLFSAIKQQDARAVVFFLEAGASANAPLLTDRSFGQIVKEAMIRRRQNPIADDYRPTPLLWALSLGQLDTRQVIPPENVPLLKALFDKGADIRATDADGNTPLILAASDGYAQTAKLLLDRGSDANARNKLGLTALMCAFSQKSNGLLSSLLDKGAEVNARDKWGETALMKACAADNANLSQVKLLLDRGADVNAQSKQGRTALMEAARKGKVAIIQALLNREVEVNFKNRRGETALQWAKKEKRPAIVRLLKQAGAKE